MYAGAGYHCTCSKSLSNSCDCYTLLWSTRRCGRWQNGCADWKKNCSRNYSSCCGWHNHNPLHRSSGKNRCAGAGWRNTAPTSHSYSCDRWNRWFRSWFGHKHSYNYGIHYWCKLRPADSVIPMYGYRIPGRCPTHKHRIRGSW